MSNRQIILATFIFLAGWPIWLVQCRGRPNGAALPNFPPAAATQPDVIQGGPYLPPSPMIQPAPPVLVYPPQTTVAPVPGIAPTTPFVPGGAVSPQFGLPAGPESCRRRRRIDTHSRRIRLPCLWWMRSWPGIKSWTWSATTSDRARAAPRRDGEVWTEGLIQTAPQDGATWLEPHRHDSVGTFNRWESTFQTIRRRAVVRVIPDAAGYLVEVIVEKELEDLPSPEKATAGAATFRADGSLPSRRLEQVSRTRSSPRWIQLGPRPCAGAADAG